MSRVERDGLIYNVIIVGNSTIEVLVPDVNAEVPAHPTTPDTSTEERIKQLEDDNAILMLGLAQAQIKQSETDDTVADLMLIVASMGGVPL